MKIVNFNFPSAPLMTSAVCFCGTILTVTRTGRYPASLVFRKPGLSSDCLELRLLNNPQPPTPTLPPSSLRGYAFELQSSAPTEVKKGLKKTGPLHLATLARVLDPTGHRYSASPSPGIVPAIPTSRIHPIAGSIVLSLLGSLQDGR